MMKNYSNLFLLGLLIAPPISLYLLYSSKYLVEMSLICAMMYFSFKANPHLMLTLIRLELLSILTVWVLSMSSLTGESSFILVLIFLAVSVGEMTIGLSLMSRLNRLMTKELTHSNF